MNTNSSMLKQCQAELASLKKDLPKLKAVADEAEEQFANSRQGRPVYPRDQISPYSNAKVRIDELAREVARLQGLVNWDEGVQSAGDDVRRAKKSLTKAQSEMRILRDKRETLELKREALIKKHDHELKAAEDDEHEAAQAYARAMVESDGSTERKAEGLLHKASHALAVIRQAVQGASTVSSALSTQVSELDNAIGQKQAEIDSLNSQLLQAARFYWADRFERAALELGTLATHLSAVEKLRGRGDGLADFYIPTVSPTKSNFISHRRIMDQRSNINLDQLINI